jgi:hypothetical protein
MTLPSFYTSASHLCSSPLSYCLLILAVLNGEAEVCPPATPRCYPFPALVRKKAASCPR